MKLYRLEAAPTASAKELKNEKSAKAKQILVGADVHLRGYQVARKVDNGVVGVVENFRSEAGFMLLIEKQLERAEQVVVVYEAGPLGFTLYRKLTARGVLCYVCAPDSSEQQKKRRKNNKIDARSLTSKLFNYLNGDQSALQLARVPTEAQEQLRLASRQQDQLVEERKRLGAKRNAMLLSQGFGSWNNWWRPKAWAQLNSLVPPWLLERLKVWVDVLKMLDEKICQAKAAFARTCKGSPRPKGVGALSQMQLQSEVLDWSLYTNRQAWPKSLEPWREFYLFLPPTPQYARNCRRSLGTTFRRLRRREYEGPGSHRPRSTALQPPGKRSQRSTLFLTGGQSHAFVRRSILQTGQFPQIFGSGSWP